ncbi:copper resistance protein CopC [Meiothermus sp. QL-1]|uniref:copper resistance CopC family protein n=1 Tax=Meiothermus sp. QL-1 TaxID=2058095 RepID=UPI000E0ACA89|nr:copper resistance CopC family protein [Meiothermus sp. QL-1]RDI94884.1 copper resistance protein CopC [Meiothermus sp. QL-1]
MRWGLVLLGGLALAHAEYKSSVPPAGAVLRLPPKTVTVHFTEPVEVRLSTFKVYPLEAQGSPEQLQRLAAPLVRQALSRRDDQARRVDTGLLTSARTSRSVTLRLRPDLRPGVYVVMWRNLSVDGHSQSGYFVFIYRP